MIPRLAALLLLYAALFAGSAGCGNKYDYTVEEYRAAFTVTPGSPDVTATLDILYAVGETPKGDGFKFVGSHAVRNLTVRDDRGTPLRCEVVPMRETKIAWYFDPIVKARKRVIVNFTLPGYLRKDGDTYLLDASWTGIFRVPVRHARYELLFPAGLPPKIISSKPEGDIESVQGALAFIARQAPLNTETFSVSFTIDMTTASKRGTRKQPSIPTGKVVYNQTVRSKVFNMNPIEIMAYTLPLSFVFFVIVFAIYKANHDRKGKGGSSSDGAGGSSCSGGGCSSCGGGCGGGCGG